MPALTSPALDRAIKAVPVERFHGVDGEAVRPCTPAAVTHRHLGMLDVLPGANVMDIGVGSGLSAALLAQLTGTEGNVTAVEIEPDLARRAEGLYAEHGHEVNVVVGDGLLGYSPSAPYDRILVGTTPPAIPDAWLQQLKPGGTLLCGVRIADLPGAYAVARISVDGRHHPRGVEIHHGGYTPMIASHPLDTACRAVDPQRPGRSLTVLGEHDPSIAASLLTALTDTPHIEFAPTTAADYFHLKNWLIAVAPECLLEATLDQGIGIGIGSLAQDGQAHVAVVADDHLIADQAESSALDVLRTLIHHWLSLGAPRTHALGAHLIKEGDVWHARLTAATQ